MIIQTYSAKALQELETDAILFDFWILDQLVIWKREKYYIMHWHELIHGLLFVPHPNDDEKTNFSHFDNTTLIKNQSFWQDLLKIWDLIWFCLIMVYAAGMCTWKIAYHMKKDRS